MQAALCEAMGEALQQYCCIKAQDSSDWHRSSHHEDSMSDCETDSDYMSQSPRLSPAECQLKECHRPLGGHARQVGQSNKPHRQGKQSFLAQQVNQFVIAWSRTSIMLVVFVEIVFHSRASSTIVHSSGKCGYCIMPSSTPQC